MMNKLIIALGNPGKKFEHTRHNLGQDIAMAWVEHIQEQGAQVSEKKSQEKMHARIQEALFQNTKITILYPDVFMNDSGKAVMQYLRYNEVDRKDIVVIHDDLELPLGEVKFQESGSAKGHNGVRSIHEYLGALDIPRLRVGIGRPVDATTIDKFVLEKFAEEEKAKLADKQDQIFDAIEKAVFPPLI